MKLRRVFVCGIAGIVLAGGRLLAADSNPTNAVAATAAVYVPDTSHQNEPLPDGVLAWDGLTKETTVAADAGSAHFVFSFTNIATVHETVLATNITTLTNITAVTRPVLFLVQENFLRHQFLHRHQRHDKQCHQTGSRDDSGGSSILRLHHGAIAAVALDHCARHQRTDCPHGQCGRENRHADQNGQRQDRQRLQTAYPQNQHFAAGDSDPIRGRARAGRGNGQNQPPGGF